MSLNPKVLLLHGAKTSVTASKGVSTASGGKEDDSREALVTKCYARNERENYEVCKKAAVLSLFATLASSATSDASQGF